MTTTDLAPLSAPPNQWVAEMSRWEHLLTDATIQQSAEAIDKAKLIREIVKIRKLTADIAAAASRVEAVALRRLGQLGGANGLHPTAQRVARYLAEIDTAAFHQLLVEITDKRGIGAVVRQRISQEQAEAERAEGRDRARTNKWNASNPAWSSFYFELKGIRALVYELFATDHPTTIEQAAREMLDLLDAQRPEEMAAGAEEVVRKAIDCHQIFPYNAPGAGEINGGDVSAFIIVDTEAGWVRIPVADATPEQLRWMASHRREQIEMLERDVRALEHEAAEREREAS